MNEEFFGDVAIGLYKDKIVQVRHPEEWQGEDTLEVAKEVMDGIKRYVGTEPKGLLIIGPSTYKNKEVLDYYNQRDVNEVARALITPSFAAKVFGNMYLKLAKNKKNEIGRHVPTKLFADKEKGVLWLYEQIKNSAS
ncbi:MAG: hypothetical protein ACRBFS_09780 [Aureispira sp.]